MLTDNQNKLIEDLRIEFSKMNKPTPTMGGGLINKAAMDNRFAESDRRRSELQSITNATEKAVLELMDMDMERLNYDLIPMGIIATRNKNNQFYVRIDSLGNQNSDRYTTSFSYQKTHKYEDLSDGTGYTCYTGLSHISWCDYRFNSIDELCRNDRFVRDIENMYKSLVNNKNK